MAEGGKKIEVVSECYFIMPTGKKKKCKAARYSSTPCQGSRAFLRHNHEIVE